MIIGCAVLIRGKFKRRENPLHFTVKLWLLTKQPETKKDKCQESLNANLNEAHLTETFFKKRVLLATGLHFIIDKRLLKEDIASYSDSEFLL